jgi:hypothetical protein
MNGNKHGEGKYKSAEGGEYIGEWKNGEIHGEGAYKWQDGSEY